MREEIAERIGGYAVDNFYVEKLVEGITTLAASFAPERVIVRLSDFKSNEYRNLVGGPLYEPEEENPMLGFEARLVTFLSHSARVSNLNVRP